MGTLGDISNLIFQAYRLWQEQHAGRTVTPQEIFDKYVAPTYQLFKQIHGDYMNTYLELRERIALEDTLSPQKPCIGSLERVPNVTVIVRNCA